MGRRENTARDEFGALRDLISECRSSRLSLSPFVPSQSLAQRHHRNIRPPPQSALLPAPHDVPAPKLHLGMGGRGVGPGMMGRPPPPRLPPNLPALQGMGNPPGGGGGGPDNMGPRSGANGMGGGGSKNGLSQGGANGGGGGGPSGGGGGPSINVYVGKLKPETDNALVQELLMCCGRVEKWNRAVDPSTDLPKAFGFCTYRNAQAAAVSVQVRSRVARCVCDSFVGGCGWGGRGGWVFF